MPRRYMETTATRRTTSHIGFIREQFLKAPGCGFTYVLVQQSIQPSRQIPIVAVCGFAFVLGTLTCWRRRKTIAGLLRNRVIIANSSTGTRELTADQLAGSINNDQNSNTRARRSRRPPRRTPSQLSTHSLPAYAKEPGEQELVVLQ